MSIYKLQRIGAGIGLMSAGIVAYLSLYYVKKGHKAVIFNRLIGVKKDVYGEGFHFKIPLIEHVIEFDVRNKPYANKLTLNSKDNHKLDITFNFEYKPRSKKLPDIYLNLGPKYAEILLPAISNEIFKEAIQQFNKNELVYKNTMVTQEIEKKLVEKSKKFHILVENLTIEYELNN